MIGNLIDRAIGVFSPAAAVRRVHARNVLNRSYEAAKRTRLNPKTPPNRAADVELSESADIIRGRARALVRDNAYANGVLRAMVRNVVGCGFMPQAQIENANGYNETAEKAFKLWQRRADLAGRLTFAEIQRLAYSEVIEAGEVLIRFVDSARPGSPVPLALEVVEADQFAVDHFSRGINPETGNEVRRGVEVSETGEPVAYWLYTEHPADLNTWKREARRFAASQFLHLFKQQRPGQTRGVSAYAPVLTWLKNLGYYVDNELQSSAVASCFSAAITSHAGPADGGLLPDDGDDSTDVNGNTFDHIEPGMVARLLPGEDITTINPSRAHSEAAAWIDLMLRSMAVGTGLSYERLSRDYSKTNYSSNRASDLEDRREFRPEQEWLIHHLCIPVWERFFVSAVAHDVQGFPSPIEFLSDPDGMLSHNWQAPGWEWVDPAKEQKASADAISSNLSTLADELGKRGKDWREVLKQRAAERKFAEELGLTPVIGQPDSDQPGEENGDDTGGGSDSEKEAEQDAPEARQTSRGS